MFVLGKRGFLRMHQYIRPSMRDTAQRSVFNALAMLLLVLRFGIPQRFLAILFGTTQPVVSDAINRTKELLTEHFVSRFLGFGHIERNTALSHNSMLIDTMFDKPGALKVIVDGKFLRFSLTFTSSNARISQGHTYTFKNRQTLSFKRKLTRVRKREIW
jgi:hypothetical protein